MSYSLLSPDEHIFFNAGAVGPFECLAGGWRIIRDQYFLFVGMFTIIVVGVTCIPFAGIIYGAWMIGIYHALLGRMRGEPASFNAIGKGFGFFSQGFVIALLSGMPFALISVGAKLMEMRFDEIEKSYPGETPVPDEVLLELLYWLIMLISALVLFHLVTGLIFPFAYQLVVERNLTGWQAIKLSATAARSNFGGVLGLVVLEIILGGMGILLCGIGLVLVMPLTKAAWAVAYRQVFPALLPEPPVSPPLPPPPPPFAYGAG